MDDRQNEPTGALSRRQGDSPVVWMAVDVHGVIIDTNATTARLLCPAGQTLVGTPLVGLGAQTANGQPMLKQALTAAQEQTSDPARYVVELVRADGAPLVMLYTVQPLKTADGQFTGTQHWAMELSAPVMEERLRVARQGAQRELIANLSHNLNNILTGVLAPAQLLLETVYDPDAQQDLRDILDATTRARTLLREVYRTVRAEPEPIGPVALTPLLSGLHARSPSVKLRFLGDTDGLQVMAVEEGLKTILNQLVHNAVESNPTSGVVEIEGRIREGWLYLTIRDDGAGMDQAAQRRVFEPLFTTKSGVGVGMSLAAARPRLQQWGGDIFLHSTIDVGTAVTLKVRLVPRRPRPVQRGRVLIVEDEPHIARALKRLFGRNNDVELAHDGNDVLVRYAPTDFDVAIIDLSMPQMSGDTLAHALRERDPTLSLILLTGWLIQPDDPLMEGFDGLLQKPLTDLSTARQRIAEAIATTRQRRAATPPGSPPG